MTTQAQYIIKGFALDQLNVQKFKPGVNANEAAQPQPVKHNYQSMPPVVQRDTPIRISQLGTPVMSDLSFGQVTIDGIRLPVFNPIDTVVFTIQQSKNIVKTAIQGRSGTIKEYIGNGDYQINIKGVICGDNGVYPYDDVANLQQYMDAPASLPIVSQFLQQFGIYEVVIESFTLGQREGFYSTQLFEISAVSDSPVILKRA